MWVAASKENALPGKGVRFQVTQGAFHLVVSITITGKIEQCTGDWISLRVQVVQVVPANSPTDLASPGDLMIARFKQCQVEEIPEEEAAPVVPFRMERDLNFQLVQMRRADDLRNQIQRARREGRALDVFCMELELGDYRT
jgi:hypothetical protein